jgi:hypothetical protein
MTNERWHIIASDGLLTDRLVPPEFFVVDQDENRASAAYSAAWGAHDAAVEQPGLAFDVTMLRRFLDDDPRLYCLLSAIARAGSTFVELGLRRLCSGLRDGCSGLGHHPEAFKSRLFPGIFWSESALVAQQPTQV